MTQVLQDGELIAERFDIVRLIAEGGMGQVYEARDRVLGGRVALKLLNRANLDDPRINRRFRREIQLARQVTHANVCRLYDVYAHHVERSLRPDVDVTLVTMELLDGETLEACLERRGRLSEADALPIVQQMCEALQAAHDAGVIHRDFKPSNVMMVPEKEDPESYRAVVTDFGLARSTGPPSATASANTTPLSSEMRVVGTADYMAPEQMRGRAVTPASDIYALGVVLYEMVTGARPYTANNPLTLLTKRATEPPTSPLEHHPELDRHWAEVILRCLADEPEERPPSPAQVVALLMSDDELAAAEAPPPRPSRRRIALFAAVGLLAVGLLFVLALRRHPPAAVRYGQAVQLTSDPGLELDASFSSDGKAVVFSSNQSGSFEIYFRELGPGGETRRLTHDGDNFEPVLTADDQFAVYHSIARGGLWEVPVTGGPARQISEDGSRPAFAPGRDLMVFQSESSPLLTDSSLPAFGLSTLWLLDRGDGSRRQLTRAGEPEGAHAAATFSPDGERVVFTSSRRRSSEIWSIDIEGGELVKLVDDPNPAYDPVLSHDGRRLYFSGSTRRIYALWSLPLDRRGRATGLPEMVSNLGLASFRLAAIAPDGEQMAYTALFANSNLYSLPLTADDNAAGDPVGLTRDTSRVTRAAFSPDGSLLVCERSTRGGNVDLWQMNSDGSGEQPLTVGEGDERQPSWFRRDGRDLVAYQIRAGDVFEIRQVDPESGADSSIATLPGDADWAYISPDGQRIAYHSRAEDLHFRIHVLDLTTGEARALSDGRELMAFPRWSPDSRRLVFQTRRDENHQVTLLDADGGEPTVLTAAAAQHYPYSFSPDGRRVVFASDRGGDWNLWWIDVESGEERQLTRHVLPGGYVRYPAWSPDGGAIVYELTESSGDLWIAGRIR